MARPAFSVCFGRPRAVQKLVKMVEGGPTSLVPPFLFAITYSAGYISTLCQAGPWSPLRLGRLHFASLHFTSLGLTSPTFWRPEAGTNRFWGLLGLCFWGPKAGFGGYTKQCQNWCYFSNLFFDCWHWFSVSKFVCKALKNQVCPLCPNKANINKTS